MSMIPEIDIDPWTGAELHPGDPDNCQGNGEHPDYEICCDNCNYFLECFPEYDKKQQMPTGGGQPDERIFIKRETVNKKMSGEQLKARKRRVRFLVLMIISGIGALLTLYLPAFPSGTPEYALHICVCAAFILTFLISGIGLIANLFQRIVED